MQKNGAEGARQLFNQKKRTLNQRGGGGTTRQQLETSQVAAGGEAILLSAGRVEDRSGGRVAGTSLASGVSLNGKARWLQSAEKPTTPPPFFLRSANQN